MVVKPSPDRNQLPPIIFEAGFNMNASSFFENIGPTMFFAFAGEGLRLRLRLRLGLRLGLRLRLGLGLGSE